MFDSQFRELLTMTVQFTITFSSLLVEHEDFVTLHERSLHFANHFCAIYRRSAHCDVAVVVYQQNFLKFNSLVSFGVLNVINKQFLAFFCLELLTVNFYNCVHYYLMIKRFSP